MAMKKTKKLKSIDIVSGIETADKKIKLAIVFVLKTIFVLFLVLVSFLIFVHVGPSVANNYYHSFDNALFLNALCNTVLTIWGLIVAVYLHHEILGEEYDDWLTRTVGKFWSNLTRPKVSVFLLVSSMMLFLTFDVIKRTELRIEELTKIIGQ
jgi:hypothetical protein